MVWGIERGEGEQEGNEIEMRRARSTPEKWTTYPPSPIADIQHLGPNFRAQVGEAWVEVPKESPTRRLDGKVRREQPDRDRTGLNVQASGEGAKRRGGAWARYLCEFP